MRGGRIGIFLYVSLMWIHAVGQHNNEFYIKGAHVTIQNGVTLHVQGDLHIDEGNSSEKGRFNNDGEVELRGDLYIRHTNVEITDGVAAILPATSTGVVRFKNSGYATETDHEDENQTIFSVGGSDYMGLRAFYDIELENDNTAVGVAGDFVDMDGGDIEVKNSLTFNNDSRLRTDNTASPSTPPSGDDYSYELFINNVSETAIIGESTTAGDNIRYIEGKLSWQVSGTRDYVFPIGLQPNFIGTDGMASFELSTNAAPDQKIDAWLNKGITALGVPNIYCDIGDYPDASTGTQPWNNCVGGPDGLYDFANLNLEMSHEWVVENSGADFTYDLEVYPGPGLDATLPSTGTTCGTAFHLRFLAKNGALMDGAAVGSVITAPSPLNPSDFPIGFDLCPPATKAEGNRLLGQTSFSRFRPHGANFSETALPVELITLQANPINNTYIEVFWQTASEINNEGFELERSLDGSNFEQIGWIPGAGTVTELQSYLFDDLDVIAGQVYYYRLKQIDFGGEYEYSNIVNASLLPLAGTVTLYPNPVVNTFPILELHTDQEALADVLILNAIGQEVIRHSMQIEQGVTRHIINTEALASGTYIVNVFSENLRFSEKLVIVK